jgi:hypothetical protein
MAVLSIVFLVLANVVFRLGPSFFSSALRHGNGAQDDIARIFDSGIRFTENQFYLTVFCLAMLGALLFLFQLPGIVRRRRNLTMFIINGILLAASFSLLAPSVKGYRIFLGKLTSCRLVHLDQGTAQWLAFSIGGFDIRLPPELKENISGSTDPFAAYEKGIPFEYAGFVPEGLLQCPWRFERFELRFGVHQNKENLTVVEYVKRKNEQLKRAGRQVDVFIVQDVAAANLKGLEDVILVAGPEGKQTLCRNIFPYKDKFLVISAVVGSDRIIPEYKAAVEAVCQTLAISRKDPPKPLKAQKPAKQGKKIRLEEF